MEISKGGRGCYVSNRGESKLVFLVRKFCLIAVGVKRNLQDNHNKRSFGENSQAKQERQSTEEDSLP